MRISIAQRAKPKTTAQSAKVIQKLFQIIPNQYQNSNVQNSKQILAQSTKRKTQNYNSKRKAKFFFLALSFTLWLCALHFEL